MRNNLLKTDGGRAKAVVRNFKYFYNHYKIISSDSRFAPALSLEEIQIQ